MELLNTEFKRLFSTTFYKSLKLKLADMSFAKDFINDRRGDLYPLLHSTEDCRERVEHHRYLLSGGMAERFFCAFFPYATYEVEAEAGEDGEIGFVFRLPTAEVRLSRRNGDIRFSENGAETVSVLPQKLLGAESLIVSCRPKAFDVYLGLKGKAVFFVTFPCESFAESNRESAFREGSVALLASGNLAVTSVSSYVDSGVSLADMRPIRYENGKVMTEAGRIFFTGSIRMRAEMFQGVFSWIPGTAEITLTGALFYDCGDGKWCGDVAASILYHREKREWYLWVCSFSHGHVLAHSAFTGDPRFGVNVIDVELMEKAEEGADSSVFKGFFGDEDPDFYYDEALGVWRMAICRVDPDTKKYRYHFWESDEPFKGYRLIGRGLAGAETGGSFVSVEGERYFLCGNDFHAVSDYRIYHKNGMTNACFRYPDGGFRGWGSLIPVEQGSRTRYYWITFDRHNGSDSYNWSYGNFYCFEAT